MNDSFIVYFFSNWQWIIYILFVFIVFPTNYLVLKCTFAQTYFRNSVIFTIYYLTDFANVKIWTSFLLWISFRKFFIIPNYVNTITTIKQHRLIKVWYLVFKKFVKFPKLIIYKFKNILYNSKNNLDPKFELKLPYLMLCMNFVDILYNML